MMLRNKKIFGLLFSLLILLITGCFKDKTVIFDTTEEITRPVGFAAEILPIFNNSCTASGCHSTGGISPDLTASRAYTSLVNGNFLNVGNPEASDLYLWMTGKKGTPMPTSGINKDYNALVLAWIKQGAENN